MKKKANKYLELISSAVHEPDNGRAIVLLLQRYRNQGDDLQMIAMRLGIDSIKDEVLPFDGGVFDIDGRLVIKINSLSPPVRRRFTLAHEIAHLALDSFLSLKPRLSCTASPVLERACDFIAAELLMPSSEVVPFVSKLGFQSPEKLQALARRFDVSLYAAAVRVHRDLKLWKRPIGLWNYDSSAEELWFVGKRPWNTKHPSFAAFDLAKRSSGPVCTQELYSNGHFTEPVSLKVLRVGRNRLLGMVAVA